MCGLEWDWLDWIYAGALGDADTRYGMFGWCEIVLMMVLC